MSAIGGSVVATTSGPIMTEAAPTPPSPPSGQRTGTLLHAVADVLDFVTIFFAGGVVVAWLTGNLTTHGWSLFGWSGWAHTLVIIAYFWLGRGYLGGTIWQRIFGIR
jgi:uncharacterized membrane protein YoaK (UPF0700 family)